MGTLGALGKINETSSNLLLLRQFSARKILCSLSICLYSERARHAIPASPAIPESMCDDDGSGVSLEGRHNKRCLVSHDEVESGSMRYDRGSWGRSDLV
jgi:hypothetical protein